MSDHTRDAIEIGRVRECWHHPIKSMQGHLVERVEVGVDGIVGDRARALRPVGTEVVLSAKRAPALLDAIVHDGSIGLPDGTSVDLAAVDRDERLSDWLGRPVELVDAAGTAGLGYEMTFDPPDDEAEYFRIPLGDGTFVDLAPLHVIATATLDGCAASRPDLDWDVRRFRPSFVFDVAGDFFVEDDWVGRRLRLGPDCVISVSSPTVRCAMPLRAQPAAATGPSLARQPELFAAMGELHEAHPNHLGAYADVVTPGVVRAGDQVALED